MRNTIGYVKIKRGMTQSDFFKREPYCERAAWLWMIEAAAWQDTVINVASNPVELKRGQFCHSLRFMSQQFQWHIGKTRRFLKRLEAFKMIETPSGTQMKHLAAQITLCNYSKYQDTRHTHEQESDTLHGTNKKKKEDKNKEDRKKEAQAPLVDKFVLPVWLDEQDWRDFVEMRKKLRKPLTERAAKSIFKKLQEFKNQGYEPRIVLENSIRNSWQDVYQPKGTGNETHKSNNTGLSKSDRAKIAILKGLEDYDNGEFSWSPKAGSHPIKMLRHDEGVRENPRTDGKHDGIIPDGSK